MQGTFQNFFGLRENPFNGTPDPRFLVPTDNMRRTLAELTHAIQTRKSLILLTGEVGTGKTVLIHHLLEHLRREDVPRAFIFNSHGDVNELFNLILAGFGVQPRLGGASGGATPVGRLQQWLAEPHRLHRNAVLIIDEAQGLPLSVLEEIRLLLNLGVTQGKALQVVLAGQPELEERLRRPEYRAIRQRVNIRCLTIPLSRSEADEYISGRLRVAGADGAISFPTEAVDLLYFYSRGIPRVLNLLCEHSLMRAYATGLQSISIAIVEDVACQLQFDELKPVAAVQLSRAAAAGTGVAGANYQSTYQSGAPMAAPMENSTADLNHAVSGRQNTSAMEPVSVDMSRIEKKYPVIKMPIIETTAPATVEVEVVEVATAPQGAHAVTVAAAPSIAPPIRFVQPKVTRKATTPPDARPSAPAEPYLSAAIDASPAAAGSSAGQDVGAANQTEIPVTPAKSADVLLFSRKYVAPFLDRVELEVRHILRVSAVFAKDFTRRERLTALRNPAFWDQSWAGLVHWLKQPMGAGKSHESMKPRGF
jgi:general secretion pathway protein A